MQVICPQCDRLVEVTVVRVSGPTAFISCARCGVESGLTVAAQPERPVGRPEDHGRTVFLASSAEASNVVRLKEVRASAATSARAQAEHDAFTVPPNHCPKCISPSSALDSACRTCGLTFRAGVEHEFNPPDYLATLWKELLRRWDDEGQHLAVRQAAMARQDLSALGRLYRLRLAYMPDDPWAQKGRDDVFAAASAVMVRPLPSQPQAENALVKSAVIVVCVLVIGAALVMLMRLLAGLST